MSSIVPKGPPPPKQIGNFTRGTRYALLHIKKQDNKFYYLFSDGKQKFAEEFNTVADAEKLISELSGETLPDYSKYHERKNS